nr:hypothetical protein [Candidatus Microthrix sp.]
MAATGGNGHRSGEAGDGGGHQRVGGGAVAQLSAVVPPQQRASPLLRATQVWSWPAAMLVAPVMLETATGVVESVVVPLPS